MLKVISRFVKAVLFDLSFKTFVSRKIASIAYFLVLVAMGMVSIGLTIGLARTLLWDLSYFLPAILSLILVLPLGIALAFLIWVLIMIPVRVSFEVTLSLLLIADKVSLISESFSEKE